MNRLIVFESVHQAIRTERLLQDAGIFIDMIPTPREISASCGQSLAFHADDLEAVRRILEQEKVLFRGIFSSDSNRRSYELIFQGSPQ